MDEHDEIKHLREIIKQKELEIFYLNQELDKLKKENVINTDEDIDSNYDVNLASLWSL